jgi:hypothetical protein
MRHTCLVATLAAVCILTGCGPQPKVVFGPQHEMIVDGELLLPVHAWAGAMKDLDRLKRHGVNVVLGFGDCSMTWKPVSDETVTTTKQFLDELQKRDMYGVIIVSSWWSKPANRGIYKDKKLADYMANFTDHPALLGWQSSIEDDMGLSRSTRKKKGIEGWAPRPGGTAADLKARYEAIKAADPTRPVVLMWSGGQMLARDRKWGWTVPTPEAYYVEAARWCDILYHDLFPVANGKADDLKQIADATDLLVKYAAGKKHLWVAVDAGDRKRWSTKSHAPTGEEIRNELWQAVIHGAHGLGFDYTSWKPTWASIRMSADGEKGLTAAVAEIQTLREVILLGNKRRAYTVVSTGEGSVDVAVRIAGDRMFVFAVNVTGKPCKATLAVSGLKDAPVEVIGEGRTVPVVDGKMSDTFDAWAVHLYVQGDKTGLPHYEFRE